MNVFKYLLETGLLTFQFQIVLHFKKIQYKRT